jgi:hypothetical protein
VFESELDLCYRHSPQEMCCKSFKETDLDALQARIDVVLCDVESMLPLFFSGRITKKQMHYFTRQVSLCSTAPTRYASSE